MSNGSGIGWDGALRDPNRQQPQPISPYDRAPVPRQIVETDTALADGKILGFAGWCSWVFIEDDGGSGGLYVRPGRAGGPAQQASTGRIIWIGDGSCVVGYTSSAPTRPIRLMGCNAEDARIYASNGGATILAATPTVATGSTIYRYQFKAAGDLLSPINPPANTISTDIFVENGGAADVLVGPNVGDIALGQYILIPAGSNNVVSLPGIGAFEWQGDNPDIAVAQFLTA